MKKAYPKTYSYLIECRKELESRERRRFAGEEFYQYSRPQNFEVMQKPKILVPAIADYAKYAIDERGEYFYVGSGGGGGGAHAILTNIEIDQHYLLGLLNSRCLDKYLQIITTPFHSGWYAYSKGYIEQIPILLPETGADQKLAARIAESVKKILAAKAKLRSDVMTDRLRGTYESEIEHHERRIDGDVFKLYGVDGLPNSAAH